MRFLSRFLHSKGSYKIHSVHHLPIGRIESIFFALRENENTQETYIRINSISSENLCHKLTLGEFQNHSLLD